MDNYTDYVYTYKSDEKYYLEISKCLLWVFFSLEGYLEMNGIYGQNRKSAEWLF